MSVSLFERALPAPCTLEGEKFHSALKIPKSGTASFYRPNCRANLVVAQLVLQTCYETAEAIEKKHYKEFDALVRNCGCQITALQNLRYLKTKHVHKEVDEVKQIASKAIAKIQYLWNETPLPELNMDLLTYLKKHDLDIQLSPEMAHLVCHKILNIVNTNILDRSRTREVAHTNLDNILLRINQLVATNNEKKLQTVAKKNILVSPWIDGLQAQEAKDAVKFIQKIADGLLSNQVERSPLLHRLLSDKFVLESKVRGSSNTPIVSLPQLYNAEAALRAVNGIVLVKNKLWLCDVPIREARPIKTFIKMPEERLLTDFDVRLIPKDEPVIVLEGYIPSGTNLEEKVKQFGVHTLLNATISRLHQYASGTSNEYDVSQEVDDPEAQRELKEFANNHEAFKVIEIDHMYCNSMEKEYWDQLPMISSEEKENLSYLYLPKLQMKNERQSITEK